MGKKAFVIGVAAYVCLLVLSMMFYKERILFADSAYELFYILKDNAFTIQHFRFGAVLTQIFPLLAFKIGLPLDGIMLAASGGFISFYFISYMITGLFLRRVDFALVILLCNLLFVAHTFYWIQSELPQGIVFFMVFMAYQTSAYAKKSHFITLIISGSAVITLAFFHPLLLFPFLFCISFFYLKNDLIDRRVLVNTAVFYVLMVALKAILFRTPYDQHSMGGARHFITLFPNYLQTYSNIHFIKSCLTNYYWIPILSLVILTHYIKRQEWRTLVLFCCFLTGYLLLVNISYPDNKTTSFYIENLYLPIAVIIALPFVFDVLPELNARRLGIAILLLIVSTGLIRIYNTSALYTARINYERNFLVRYQDKKLMIDSKNAAVDTLLIAWGTPYEFWLLSTTENNKTASVIVSDSLKNLYWASGVTNQFVTPWGAFPYRELPKRYFIFTDSLNGYTIVK